MAKKARAHAAQKFDWEGLFTVTNTVAMADLGDTAWAAMIKVAADQLAVYNIQLNGRREPTILALGTFIGASMMQKKLQYDAEKAAEEEQSAAG